MKTIIVATDFSTEAINAMEHAAKLAQRMGARIILFNSYQLPEQVSPLPPSSAEIDNQLNKNREYLAGLALQVSEQYYIEVDYWTNLTHVAEGLNRLVARSNADLLVMVPHKPDFGEAFFYESRTREMALRTKVPLLVLPGEA